ncbi:uncharacterized protein ColSpa_07133 [Colletotrichum spaethianum]|uniref:Uncharacterized protein n=1 Tax=Colletotrichum spaethianum TaxID=700344 RepID=A0AA37LEA9_9PEZI|nr:uncharacterized protein ColSpa_07133 [Colletotrichum spaethianum]GKT46952.1 hypothetical protein ColSpa_07133 [Colletotrichum spaethianum]
MAPVTVWDDKARSDLLVAFLTVNKPSKEDWDRALAVVHDKGYTYNANAVMYFIPFSSLRLFAFAYLSSLPFTLYALLHAYMRNANCYQRQHIQKLQRKEQTAGDSGEGSGTPVKKATKKATTPRKRKSPAKKTKADTEAEDNEDNEEQEETPATKKARMPKKASMTAEADEFLNTDDMGDSFETKDAGI